MSHIIDFGTYIAKGANREENDNENNNRDIIRGLRVFIVVKLVVLVSVLIVIIIVGWKRCTHPHHPPLRQLLPGY